MRAISKWSLTIVCLYLHNRLGIDNSSVGSRHIQTTSTDRWIVHGCHLQWREIEKTEQWCARTAEILSLSWRRTGYFYIVRIWPPSQCQQYRPFSLEIYIPQILNGASSSSKIGCCKKISRDFKHRPLTSCSVICTDLPGRHLRTGRSNVMETMETIETIFCCC